MLPQRTIKTVIETTGVGLHSGQKVSITLRPAATNSGIVFRRVDFDQPIDLKVSPELVRETTLCTTLVNDKGVKVSTIEHLLSALAGLGIDNLYIDINSDEVPILDGSSAPFVYLLLSAGIEQQNACKKFVRITQPIEYSNGDAWARLEPFDGFKTAFEIDFDHPAVNDTPQFFEIDFSNASYVSEISRARTFGFMKDLERLRSQNLGLGGSLDNAVVMDEYKVLNSSGLRYNDEFVKHKILDAIGDLYTLGYGIIGAFKGYKSGHAINNLLLMELLQNEQAWEIVSYQDADRAPVHYTQDIAWI